MLELPSGDLLAANRLYDGGTCTSLSQLDPDTGELTELLELPSGGDRLNGHFNHSYLPRRL